MAGIPDDNSRKSVALLTNKMKKLKEQSSAKEERTVGISEKSKLNSKSPKKVAVKTPSKSNKKIRGEAGNRKITEWLSKDKLVKKKQGIVQQNSPNKRSLVVSEKSKVGSKKILKTPEKKTAKSKLPRSRSFEQYGLVMPSYKDILEEQKKYDDHKKIVAAFDEIEDVDLDLPTSVGNIDSQDESSIEVLDCKHLNSEKIEKAFQENFNYIKDISNGKKYSARHNRYHNYKTEYTNTPKDLTYNTSMIVFTDDQKLQLMSLMEETLDPENKKTKYFFQVLLPELCLKIFMDVHNMSKKKAISYLDRRPVV